MRIESDDELMAFFSPDEFGEQAILRTSTGDHPVSGHPDAAAEVARPGGVENSSRGPFITGAAEFSVYELQFSLPWKAVRYADAAAEDELEIEAGDYAGTYRIKDIQRDGEICRLMLNEL